jgi:hypothetical protein
MADIKSNIKQARGLFHYGFARISVEVGSDTVDGEEIGDRKVVVCNSFASTTMTTLCRRTPKKCIFNCMWMNRFVSLNRYLYGDDAP